jgi:DNA-binding NarL/FixJ family response regulator
MQERLVPTDSDHPILVVLGTFEPLLKLGLETAINQTNDIALVTAGRYLATSEDTAVNIPAPDIAILDERELRGLSTISCPDARRPATRFLILTDRQSCVRKTYQLTVGAVYLSRAISAGDLLDTIRHVAAGTYVTDLVDLTPREREVLNCVRRGQTYAEIAHELQISIHTAQEYGKRLRRKLRVASKRELIGVPVA